MNETFKKWSGLTAFQDFGIPNSTRTRNPIYRLVRFHKWGTHGIRIKDESGDIIERLQKRLGIAYGFAVCHASWGALNIYNLCTGTKNSLDTASVLVLNIYLVMKKVINH